MRNIFIKKREANSTVFESLEIELDVGMFLPCKFCIVG